MRHEVIIGVEHRRHCREKEKQSVLSEVGVVLRSYQRDFRSGVGQRRAKCSFSVETSLKFLAYLVAVWFILHRRYRLEIEKAGESVQTISAYGGGL
ncbi:hypothetical protein DSM117340_03028 [Lentibacter algarum]